MAIMLLGFSNQLVSYFVVAFYVMVTVKTCICFFSLHSIHSQSINQAMISTRLKHFIFPMLAANQHGKNDSLTKFQIEKF